MERRDKTRELRALLFTDLVDSTALSTRVGPERSEELRQIHFRILNDALGDHHGQQVKNTGDGIFAVFASASDALDAAVAMQQGFEVYNRRAVDPMRIRVGVSIGDVVTEDNDHFGIPVVEAARLCDAADADQILATGTAATLGAGKNHQFEDLGNLELKGLNPTPAAMLDWTPRRGSRTSIPAPSAITALPPHGVAGREAERADLAARWNEVEQGNARAVFISGEPGLGKTHLTAATARHAAERGASVTMGRCDPSLAVPYQPWIELLSHALEHTTEDVRESVLRSHGAVLGRILPDLSESPASVPDAEMERYRLFEAVVDVIRTLAALDPLFIAIDDLHWADAASAQLTRHVLDAPDLGAVMLVGTFRGTEIDDGHPAQELLATVARSDMADVLELAGLDEAAIRDLAATITGSPSEELVEKVQRETDGNAFFAIELLVNADESGDLADLPGSVRQVVMQRVHRAGDGLVNTLQRAAVVGAQFEVPLLAVVLGRDEDQLYDEIETAAAAGLVQEVGPERYGFSHALIEHTLIEELGPSRCARTHRAVSAALADGPYDHLGRRIGEYARHRLRGRREGEENELIELATLAAERASASLAPQRAVEWYEEAIQLEHDLDAAESAMHCRTLIALGNAQHDMGSGDYRETLLDAARLARRIGEDQLLITAAVQNTRGIHSSSGSTDDERLAIVEQALDVAGPNPSAKRAQLLTLAASELTWCGELEPRQSRSDEALRIARELGDPELITSVLNQRYTAIEVSETLSERLANTSEAIELADQIDDPNVQWWAHEIRIRALAEAGDYEAVAQQLDEITVRADKLAQPWRNWYVTWHRAWLVLLHGDDALAERLADEAVTLGFASGEPDTLEIYASLLINLRLHQGRLGEILPLVEETCRDNPGIPGFRSVLGLIHADLRDLDAVQRVLAHDIDARFETFPPDMVRATGLACCAEAVAEARLDEPAACLYELLLPSRDHMVHPGPAMFGSTERYLGRLAEVIAPERADDHFEAALEVHERAGAPFWIARTHLDRARFAARDGRPTDARAHAAAMLVSAENIENPWLREQAALAIS